jgi:hypothetical protein
VRARPGHAGHAPLLMRPGLAARAGQVDGAAESGAAERLLGERERNGPDEPPRGPEPREPCCEGDWREPAWWLCRGASPKPETTSPASLDASRGVTEVVPTLELLLHRLVRRVAWAGDGRAGTMRLELGAGELEGSTVVVHAEGRELHVEVELGPGLDPQAWRARIAERLNASGLHVRELEVR